SVVWEKGTLRSSSPCMKSTGDFHVATDATGDESNASFCACFRSGACAAPSSQRERNTDQSCTPWKSTPAAKISELRARASAVSKPPYEPPQMPIRLRSTESSVCRYFAAASTSLYSEAPRQTEFGGWRKAAPYIMPSR